jgi:hypothetical protein
MLKVITEMYRATWSNDMAAKTRQVRPRGEGRQSFGRTKVFVKGRIIVKEEEESKANMYIHAYSELNNICERFGAWIDLTSPTCVFILDTTKNCRKQIKALYGGEHVQKWRAGSTMELSGFTKPD